MEMFSSFFVERLAIFEALAPWESDSILLLILVTLSFLIFFISRRVLKPILNRLSKLTASSLDDYIVGKYILIATSWLPVSGLVIIFSDFMNFIPKSGIFHLGQSLFVMTGTILFFRMIDDMGHILTRVTAFKLHTRGISQAMKLTIFLFMVIFIIAILMDESPWTLLGGLGALTAIFLLLFRDTLLGFVAGIQVSLNNMVEIGDIIELPGQGVNGTVVDISLTTVKVENFDKTLTFLPAHILTATAFRNFRTLQELGLRRIKRAISINTDTIRFLTEEEVVTYKNIPRLKHFFDTLEEKSIYLVPGDLSFTTTARKEYSYTTIGLFRLYAVEYLISHPMVKNSESIIVRTMTPTAKGVALEIICFTDTGDFLKYEAIQSRIFEHLIAVTEHFSLRVFQDPSGLDIQNLPAGDQHTKIFPNTSTNK